MAGMKDGSADDINSLRRILKECRVLAVVGLSAAWVFFDELPLFQQWLGTGAVLMGLVVNQLGGWLASRGARS